MRRVKIIDVVTAILIAAAVLMAIALPLEARAEQCWQRANAEQQLAEKWHERIVNIGVARGGGLVRVYVNRETGSWTLTMLRGQNLECIISAGEDWEEVADES